MRSSICSHRWFSASLVANRKPGIVASRCYMMGKPLVTYYIGLPGSTGFVGFLDTVASCLISEAGLLKQFSQPQPEVRGHALGARDER